MRTIVSALATVAALGVGCSASKDAPSPQADASQPVTAASAAASAPASAVGSEAPAGRAAPPATVDYAALLPAHPAGLPTPLAGLRPHQSKAAAREALGGRLGVDGTVTDPALGGVPVSVGFHAETNELRYIQLTLPPTAVADLVKRWGAGTKTRMGRSREGTWWLDPQAGLQAVVEARGTRRAILTYWPLLSWTAHLGTRKGHLGYEAPESPVLGTTEADVLRAYATLGARRTSADRVDLYLPPHERRPRPTHVQLRIKDGVVTEQSIRLVYGDDAAMGDAIRAAVLALYGKPTKSDRGIDTWDGSPRVTLRASTAGGQHILTLAR